MTYNFYVQGPDDDRRERLTPGTECDFDDLLSRSAMDDVFTMTEPLTERVIRCECGWLEC